jgi:acetoin utilization deacetylase AcuC-like enzyme
MTTSTGFVFDERCFWHDPGNYALMLKPGGFVEPYNRHIENPDPKRRFLNLATVSGLLGGLQAIASRDATMDELLGVHSASHLAHVQAVAQAGGGELGTGAPIAANGWDVARRSAGCALAAVDAVMGGQVQHAYALTRPPGHHAEPERSMGFCVFSNAALAAQRAIDHHGLQRVAIVDWDVHYGNGTDRCFAQRRDVLAISVHQQAGYLQVSGEADEIGDGAGVGHSLNERPAAARLRPRRLCRSLRAHRAARAGRLQAAADHRALRL